jgi:hypothetical protein
MIGSMANVWQVELPAKGAETFTSYVGIRADLNVVLEICEFLLENRAKRRPDLMLDEALSTAAVMKYGRCFSDGKRRRLGLDLIQQLPLPYQAMHEEIYALRDVHFAHANDIFEENLAVAFVTDRPGALHVRSVSVHHFRLSGLGRSMYRDLSELVRRILPLVEQVLTVEQAKVFDHAKKIPLEDLRNLPTLRSFKPDWAKLAKEIVRRKKHSRAGRN